MKGWVHGLPAQPQETLAPAHDAYSVAEWIRRADRDGTLMEFFFPVLSPQEREVEHIEGWILGIK